MRHITKQILRLVLFVFFIIILSGCKQKQQSNATQDIVLKIGDYEVTKYQFDKEFEKRFSQTKKNDTVLLLMR